MAVARNAIPHLRLVMGGTTGGAEQEIWAMTLKLIPVIAGTPPVPPSQSQAAASVAALTRAELATSCSGAMLSAVQDFWETFGGQSFSLTYIKLNAYGSDDLQVTDPTVESTFTPVPGVIGMTSPWSSCIDLYNRTTAASKGFATHGRMSLPTGIIVSSDTGKVGAIGSPGGSGQKTLAQVGAGYATFLESVATASPGSGWYPGILYTSTNSAKPPEMQHH